MNCNNILLLCSEYKKKNNKYAYEPQSLVLSHGSKKDT